MEIKTGFEAMTVGATPTATEGIAAIGGSTGFTVVNGVMRGKCVYIDGPTVGANYGTFSYTAQGTTYTRAEVVFGFRPAVASDGDKTILLVEDSAGAAALRVIFRASGQLAVWSAKDATLRTNLGSLTVGTTYRVGLYVEASTDSVNGKYKLAIFEGDSATPLADTGLLTGNTSGTVGTLGRIRLGKYDTTAMTLRYYMDDAQIRTDTDATQTFAPWQLPTPTITNVTATPPSTSGATDGTVTVTWSPVAGATSYEVDLLNGNVTTGAQGGDAGVSPHTFTGLAAGQYTAAVRAL